MLLTVCLSVIHIYLFTEQPLKPSPRKRMAVKNQNTCTVVMKLSIPVLRREHAILGG